MKKTKIVVPALAVLLLSTAASVSGTVAWFSMNNSVKVDGMTVQTRVSSNLLIAETNLEENYSDSITQSRTGILEPASTVNGQSYWYTVNAKGDGSAIAPQTGDKYKEYSEAARSNLDNPATPDVVENNYSNALGTQDAKNTGKTNYDVAFNSSYGFNSYDASYDGGKGNADVSFGYIDYAFYIKATSAQADQVLYMSKCNLTYKNAAGDAYEEIQKGFAWRVGLLAMPATANTASADDALVLKSTIGLPKALNQNQVNPIDTTDFVAGTTPVSSYFLDPYGKQAAAGNYVAGTKYYGAPSAQAQAVTSGTALANVGQQNAAAQAATDIDAGVTSYTRIIVRLWLEGEDISCTSTTYADLTKDWKLTLEFKLGNADNGAEPAVANGVTQISSNPALDA